MGFAKIYYVYIVITSVTMCGMYLCRHAWRCT